MYMFSYKVTIIKMRIGYTNFFLKFYYIVIVVSLLFTIYKLIIASKSTLS